MAYTWMDVDFNINGDAFDSIQHCRACTDMHLLPNKADYCLSNCVGKCFIDGGGWAGTGAGAGTGGRETIVPFGRIWS